MVREGRIEQEKVKRKMRRTDAFVRWDCDLREWISITGMPAALKSSEKKPTTRAVAKKTMILWLGSFRCSSTKATSEGSRLARGTTSWNCGTAACELLSPCAMQSMNAWLSARSADLAISLTACGTVAEKSSV